MSISRTCQFCGSGFEAKTTVTKYCSHTCNSRHYKEKARERNIAKSNLQTASLDMDIRAIKVASKEILKVREVTDIFGFSPNTVYDMIKSGRLKANNFGKRKTRVLRSEIFAIFEEPQPQYIPPTSIVIESELNEQLVKDGCYSVVELVSMFRKHRSVLYAFMKRNKIPKLKVGKEVFFQKTAVDKLYKAWCAPKKLGLQSEREVNDRLSKKVLTLKDCYSIDECVKLLNRDRALVYGLLNRRNIPKLRVGQEIYRSKVAVNRLVKNLKEEEGL